MKVAVDPGKCQGHARCNLIAPELFDLDEGGYAVVIDPNVATEHEAAARNAVINCPEGAIEIS
jgi:ferredoxin